MSRRHLHTSLSQQGIMIGRISPGGASQLSIAVSHKLWALHLPLGPPSRANAPKAENFFTEQDPEGPLGCPPGAPPRLPRPQTSREGCNWGGETVGAMES